jgi:hypothetical protein
MRDELMKDPTFPVASRGTVLPGRKDLLAADHYPGLFMNRRVASSRPLFWWVFGR